MDITQITRWDWYGGQSKAVELPWMLLTQFKLPPTNFFFIVIYKIYLRRRTCTTSTRRWQRRRQQQLRHLQVKDSQRTPTPWPHPRKILICPQPQKYTSWHTSELEYPQMVPPGKWRTIIQDGTYMSCLSPENKLLEHCVLKQHKEQALDNSTIALVQEARGVLTWAWTQGLVEVDDRWAFDWLAWTSGKVFLSTSSLAY